MNTFRVHLLNVKRYGAGTWSHGRFTEDTSPITIQIRASLQPVPPHEVALLPEGKRDSQSYRLYTSTELRLAEDSNPDRVIVDNEEYEVSQGAPWKNDILSHYRYLITKMESPNQP